MQLGKYEIIEELGRGGFGIVYKAHDTILDVDRALKVLHPALVSDVTFLERFKQEAQLSAKLDHPNIVPVYDYGESDGRFFLAMKYMPGGALRDLLQYEKKLETIRANEILMQVSQGMDYAHSQGIVHRDLKPGNILFDQKGNACVSDLGFAKAMSGSSSAQLSSSGGMIGTPSYMAPEIWRGKPATPASDIYSLACIYYEMLTGKVLFDGESPADIVTKHVVDGPQIDKTLPKETITVLEKALDKDPGRRFKDMREYFDAVVRKIIPKQNWPDNELKINQKGSKHQKIETLTNQPELQIIRNQNSKSSSQEEINPVKSNEQKKYKSYKKKSSALDAYKHKRNPQKTQLNSWWVSCVNRINSLITRSLKKIKDSQKGFLVSAIITGILILIAILRFSLAPVTSSMDPIDNSEMILSATPTLTPSKTNTPTIPPTQAPTLPPTPTVTNTPRLTITPTSTATPLPQGMIEMPDFINSNYEEVMDFINTYKIKYYSFQPVVVDSTGIPLLIDDEIGVMRQINVTQIGVIVDQKPLPGEILNSRYSSQLVFHVSSELIKNLTVNYDWDYWQGQEKISGIQHNFQKGDVIISEIVLTECKVKLKHRNLDIPNVYSNTACNCNIIFGNYSYGLSFLISSLRQRITHPMLIWQDRSSVNYKYDCSIQGLYPNNFLLIDYEEDGRECSISIKVFKIN